MTEDGQHEVGDLINRVHGGQNLCLAIQGIELVWLTQEGRIYKSRLENQYPFCRAVELRYRYREGDEIRRTVMDGYFDQYFDKPLPKK